jgi:hypothetical protein
MVWEVEVPHEREAMIRENRQLLTHELIEVEK